MNDGIMALGSGRNVGNFVGVRMLLLLRLRLQMDIPACALLSCNAMLKSVSFKNNRLTRLASQTVLQLQFSAE